MQRLPCRSYVVVYEAAALASVRLAERSRYPQNLTVVCWLEVACRCWVKANAPAATNHCPIRLVFPAATREFSAFELIAHVPPGCSYRSTSLRLCPVPRTPPDSAWPGSLTVYAAFGARWIARRPTRY